MLFCFSNGTISALYFNNDHKLENAELSLTGVCRRMKKRRLKPAESAETNELFYCKIDLYDSLLFK